MNKTNNPKILVEKGMYDESLAMAKKKYIADDSKYKIFQSYVFLRKGNKVKALEKALEAYSFKKTVEAAYMTAYIFNSRKKYKDLIKWLEIAIDLDPSFERVYFLISNYHNKRFKYITTLKYLTIGLESGPNNKSLKALRFDTLLQIIFTILFLTLLVASGLLIYFNIIVVILPSFIILFGLLAVSLYSKIRLRIIVNNINKQDL